MQRIKGNNLKFRLIKIGMNAIFTAVFLICTAILALTAPDKFLSSLLGGAKNSLSTTLTLFCIYAVWMGLSAVADKCRLSEKTARLFTPLAKKAFKTKNAGAIKNLAMNISCNLLGIGGAATPYAVKAIDCLEEEKNAFAQKLLFIINATSIQIVPTTVIALRVSAGSASAADIFLPSLICTAFSTAFAVCLFIVCNFIHNKRK